MLPVPGGFWGALVAGQEKQRFQQESSLKERLQLKPER